MYVHIGWSVPLLAGVRGLVEDETFPPGSNLPTLLVVFSNNDTGSADFGRKYCFNSK